MFMLVTNDLILRDFQESDISVRIHWETVETEWQLWDAPWEYDGMSNAEKQEELARYIGMMQKWVEYYRDLPADTQRNTFQIETNDAAHTYIGWVNAYRIDDNFCYTKQNGYCTIGINIPTMAVRGKGYAYQALAAFVDYLLACGEPDIYTQTWSGNVRMIHIAQKMGFEECCRKVGIRTIRGSTYDGLTFRLNKEKYQTYKNGV